MRSRQSFRGVTFPAQSIEDLDFDLRLALAEAETEGVAIDFGKPPFFYETKVTFVKHDASLGALCCSVGDAISAEFARYELRMPSRLRTIITASAMTSGDADAALAYLLRWVEIKTEGDEE